MSPALAVDVVLGILPFVVGYATLRMTSRTASQAAQVEAKRVDAAAFERARTIYEGAIDQLESELGQVRTERDRLSGEVRRLAGINDELERQTGVMHGVGGEVDRLRETNQRLLAELDRWRRPGLPEGA
jgi:septal ring factor EnvC (AmiA/AmiB activator)